MPQLQEELIHGVAFPFAFANGRVRMSSGVDHLRHNLHVIIMTAEQEYPMLPTFGCSMHRRVFDPVNLMPLATRDIIRAVDTWEKRVRIDSVQASYSPDGDGTVDLTVQFSVVGTEETSELILRQGG
jgi:phage baseplate assembly protein W